MRAIWCALIAVCLVAAGAHPHRARRAPDKASSLRVASSSSSVAARRHGVSSPELGPFVLAGAVASIAAPRLSILEEPAAPVQGRPSVRRAPRSSRGPPHA